MLLLTISQLYVSYPLRNFLLKLSMYISATFQSFEMPDKHAYYHKDVAQQVKCFSKMTILLNFSGLFLEINIL